MAPATAKRWTKKDIKFLVGQIDHFQLFNAAYAPAGVIRANIEARRAEIVLGGARGFADMLRECAQKNEDAAAHFEVTRQRYEQQCDAKRVVHYAEMVTRFAGFAADERKDIAKLEALIARVEAEGLPAEVANYMPARCAA